MTSNEQKIENLRERLSSNLLAYVRAVIKQQLLVTGENYTIGYGPDWRDGSQLHKFVMEEFGIEVYYVDRQRSDRPISVLFVLTDKLGETFKKHDFAPFLNVTLEDNGEDYFEFTNADEVTAIRYCSPLFTNKKNEENYSEFVEAVEKKCLFTRINHP